MDDAPNETAPMAHRSYRGQSPSARLADRRRRLLDAGLDSFGTVGYFGASIEAMCAAAQVSNRSFYEHFGSKEELLLAVYDELLEDLHARVLAALGRRPMEFATGARAGLHAFVAAVVEDARTAHVVIVGLIGVSERCERRRREALRTFAGVIADGIRTFDPEIAAVRNLPVLAIALVGATIEALIDWLGTREVPIERVLDELVHLFERAITR
jgi:AcrR family transcriptional regulator